MPLEAQTRLLRVLQQGEFVPVGGKEPLRTNVRIVAASHRDLAQLVRQGLFREDLFYRLNVVPLRLPPLRERIEDIPALAQHFLAKAQAEGLPAKILSPVPSRGSRRMIGRAMCASSKTSSAASLSFTSRRRSKKRWIERELARTRPTAAEPTAPPQDRPVDLASAVESFLDRFYLAYDAAAPPAMVYERVLREVERPLIERTLRLTRGNQLEAARVLGINRNTLRKKIRDLDIRVHRGP